MNEHQNQLIGIPYADIVLFFKAHPAIWHTIQRMMGQDNVTNGMNRNFDAKDGTFVC